MSEKKDPSIRRKAEKLKRLRKQQTLRVPEQMISHAGLATSSVFGVFCSLLSPTANRPNNA